VAKILVVDDSRVMRLYLRRCLERAGHEVEEWVPLSAMDVPDYVTASAPDLIISDYQMPGCNGASLARMARKARPGGPILVLTAFRDPEMEANLLKLGVSRVLTKPIVEEALLLAVRGTLAD
jgi:two-component system chemotaxis response regulator CheY